MAFTGTPLSEADRNTRKMFGPYIDIYDLTRAVEDGDAAVHRRSRQRDDRLCRPGDLHQPLQGDHRAAPRLARRRPRSRKDQGRLRRRQRR
ncbi:hypothetical protein [Protofrankia symbiont of Coriaria ruscifolia]|uniref:hypothetical protein n=1 Tax=Protofrankia symbiont of Coriaria ruscifolia TaxID=1306542 RepID=UPI001F5FAE26|nr:hypothetical protein [Protofrankia symbiont of Coriaria ruscifolia]